MKLEKYDESNVRISDINSEEKTFIDNKFSIHEENYVFNNAYKNGFWDGKKHFFDMKFNILPLGLVPTLEVYFQRYFPSTKIEKDWTESKEVFSFDNFYKNSTLGSHFNVRDYQQKGFEEAINTKKCILQAATGAGKSLILWLLTKYLVEDLDKDILIIVPQTQLVEQLEGDYIDYGEFINNIEIGKSTAKKLGKREAKKQGLDWEKLSDEGALHTALSKKIVISTWQTLQRKPKSFFERFGAILMDEVHHIDGETIQKIISFCANAEWRIGMTGTLKPAPKSQMVYTAYFHKQIKLISPRELIDRGFATEVEIYPIVLSYPGKLKYEKLQDEIDYISFNDERLDFIISLIKGLYYKSSTNNTLVLFKSVEKGFWRELEEKLGFVENLFIVHGKSTMKEREMARKVADEKDNTIIIASFATFSTGVNIKNLHNIVFTESYKSMVKIAQSIGRGMRQHKNKVKMRLFDITDKFKHKNRTYKQFEERLKIYNELELRVNKQMNYTIKNI